jgi:phenylacetate-CoA ligase
MIWIRGMNVFPSAIEAVVRGFEELGDEYEIVVEGTGALPTLRIRAERKPAVPADAVAALECQVRSAVTTAIRAAADVEILEHGALPRADGRGKRRRVVDRRRERSSR